MKIELLKGWNGSPAGAHLEPPQSDVARLLISRGIAKEITDKPKAKLQSWVKTKREDST